MAEVVVSGAGASVEVVSGAEASVEVASTVEEAGAASEVVGSVDPEHLTSGGGFAQRPWTAARTATALSPHALITSLWMRGRILSWLEQAQV